MPLRWQEVAVPLAMIVVLIILKHVPATADLPLSRVAGIVAFAYAAFLALRLVQGEEAVSMDAGWSELRASPVELVGAFGSAALSTLLLTSVFLNSGNEKVAYAQIAVAMALSIAFALACFIILSISVFTRIRWNHRVLERRSSFGRHTELAWADVSAVKSTLRGIEVCTSDRRRIIFSPYHSGAPALARFAADRARRNTVPPGGAVVG